MGGLGYCLIVLVLGRLNSLMILCFFHLLYIQTKTEKKKPVQCCTLELIGFIQKKDAVVNSPLKLLTVTIVEKVAGFFVVVFFFFSLLVACLAELFSFPPVMTSKKTF